MTGQLHTLVRRREKKDGGDKKNPLELNCCVVVHTRHTTIKRMSARF